MGGEGSAYGKLNCTLKEAEAQIYLVYLPDLLGQQITQCRQKLLPRRVNELVLPRCLFQALEQYVMPHLRTYWNQLQQVLDDSSQSNALLQEEAYQVYGALLVCYVVLSGRQYEC